MKSAMSVRPRTSSTLTSKAFISANASITTVLSEGLDLAAIRLSAVVSLPAALGLPGARGLTAPVARSLILLFVVFFLTCTPLPLVWHNTGYHGCIYPPPPPSQTRD